MTNKVSVFSTGGGGTNFEQYVQTAFLTTMIVKGNVPGIKDSSIVEIALQDTRLGYETDDLFMRCTSPLGEHRIVAQIKHEFSFTLGDETFKKVIKQLWNDFNNQKIFNPKLDKLLIIKENLNKAEANNIKTLTNWAKSKISASDFICEINRINKKEATLNIFRKVIQEVNKGEISDEDIWTFFRCLELLAYDFGNHDSTHQSYYLNLIKLSKSTESTLNESEIWALLYEFISLRNKDGGHFNLDSIVQEPFFTHFKIENLNSFYSSIDKLSRDSKLILKQISNEIHGFHIARFDLKQQITESINYNTITIITGIPGVGKSAIIKDVLREEFPSSHLVVFRADQLNAPHISNAFSNLGINNSIEDILSCLSLTPQKIIFIDSLEKLLEGDSENAFKQLYNIIIQYPDIKIVAASRKYAIDLLYLKYGIKQNHGHLIEVSKLNDAELNLVKKKFPQLNQIFTNTKIKQLLVSPKYIDFALTLILKDNTDYSETSLTAFKDKLWNHIVENISDRRAGLPRKRGKAFSKIAVDRAKSMLLFVEPIKVDEEAIDELENDNIIFKDGDNYKFSPSHDILEDWALIRYIDEKNVKFQNSKDFLTQIGNEPAIRRAFRLWIENSLIDDKEKIIELVKKSTENNEIEKFWADEILIAIFKSDNCQTFFTEFQVKFLEENHSFLKRCIHIIRTTCKENSLIDSKLLVPIGSGWYSMIRLISENITELNDSRNLIVNFLLDWKHKTYTSKELPSESIYVRDIIIHYFTQIEDKDDFWFSYSGDKKYDGIINIFFNIISVSKDYAIRLIDNALNYKGEDSNWQLRDFFDKVIENCLSGIHSRNVVKEFPDKICEVAWKTWKYVAPKKRDSFFYNHSEIDTNINFGLKEHLKDSPAGIYKTPFWNMLWSHTYKAFDFIAEFTNYCCDNYFKSEFAKNDNPIEIELKISSDKIIKQKGSHVLWQAYRGTAIATPDVLRSILISLEKFLLTIAGYKNEKSKKLIIHYYYYLLERSNNVSISGVLASLCIAYPEELEECLLPILRVREFYKWDCSRAFSEHIALSPIDYEYSFAQKEMFEHNQLPHRKKYQRGLQDFIVEYQFKIGKLNKEIFQIFDDFKKLKEEDILWKKFLNEMDTRTWEIGEYNKKTGRILIQPKYEKEVKTYVDSYKPQFDERNIAAAHTNWAYNKFNNEENISCEFENWQNAYSYLKDKKSFDSQFDRPATLSYIGLRDYKSLLSLEELEWCIKSLVNSIKEIQSTSWDRYSFSLPNVNIMEREPTLKSFSLIFKYASLNSNEEKELATLLFYCMICPIARHEKKYIIEDFRDNLWDVKSKVAENLWHLLIKYSAFRKTNQHYQDELNQERTEEVRKKELNYISSQILVNSTYDKDEIGFETHVDHFLLLAIILLPFNTTNEAHKEYIKAFMDIFFDAICDKDRLNEEFEKIQIKYEDQTELIKYLSRYLLIQNYYDSKDLLNCLLEKYYFLLKESKKVKEIYDFTKKTLEFVICELDFGVNNITKYIDYSKHILIENFWSLWDFLHEKINNSGKLDFSSLLFLDINSYGVTWDENFKDWEPLIDRENYYEQLILNKGYVNIRSILNIFVSIGHTRFLPKGLNWLVEVLKLNPDRFSEVMTAKGERLIENLFHYYCSKIKENRLLLDNYIWLLDNMIDLGSSLAYLIRENVITYKSN